MSTIKRFHKIFAISIWYMSLLLMTVPITVSAQQITAPTTPNTQNPQTTQGDLVETRNNVQIPTDATVLNMDSSISFDQGKPAANFPETDSSQSLSLWLVGAGVLAVAIVLTGAMVFISVKGLSGQPPVVAPESQPKKAVEKKVKTPTAKKVGSSKKKKRRARSKKR